MSSALRAEVAGRCLREEQLLSPVLADGFTGLRAAVDQLWLEQGTLRFRLLLAYSFPNDYAASFSELEDALVLVLREGERIRVLQLHDPTVNDLRLPEKNFVDQRGPTKSNLTARGFYAVPLEAQVGSATMLLAHVGLQGFLSNVVRVDPASVKLA